MSISKILLTVALSAILSTSALAQQQAPAQGGAPQGQAGGQGGGSSDGVTLDVTPFFTALDTSKDGKISSEEWKAGGLPDNVFTMFETDKKGYITKESLASKKHPPTVDSNKDGKLSLDELKAHIKNQQAQSSGGAAGGAPQAGGAAPGGAQDAPQGGAPQKPEGQGSSSSASLVKLDATPFFVAVDTNKDNKITPEEWKTTGLDEKIYSFFDKDNKGSFSKDYVSGLTHPAEMDANKDGKLSLDELKAFVKSKDQQSSGNTAGGAQGAVPQK